MIALAVGLASGSFLMVGLLVGSWIVFLAIGIGSGQLSQSGAVDRLIQPRQYDVVAGSMHREPVYPGEDDPVHYEEGDEVGSAVT